VVRSMWESVVVVFALVEALFLFIFLPLVDDKDKEASGKQLPAVPLNDAGIQTHYRALEGLHDRVNGSILAGIMSRH